MVSDTFASSYETGEFNWKTRFDELSKDWAIESGF